MRNIFIIVGAAALGSPRTAAAFRTAGPPGASAPTGGERERIATTGKARIVTRFSRVAMVRTGLAMTVIGKYQREIAMTGDFR